jgi:hypothetical protein
VSIGRVTAGVHAGARTHVGRHAITILGVSITAVPPVEGTSEDARPIRALDP